jgi:hypothetical protein
MKKLARQIVILMVKEFGAEEVVKRLSDPFWFQALGCVLGFDWHSSGLTTTVCGALKEAIKGLEKELGLFIAGGKGRASLQTPTEIAAYGENFSLPVEKFIYASRISAKVDNTALQDGYQLYHHTFIFTKSGLWAVIQQGMNQETRLARRYHWLSSALQDFVCEPHLAICCHHRGKALNLIAQKSAEIRQAITEFSRLSPAKSLLEVEKIKFLRLPSRHYLSPEEINLKNLGKILVQTYEKSPPNFENFLMTPGLGPKTLRALTLISELIYGAKTSWEDPARYSFAHGGKDGYPYRIRKSHYDRSIEILKEILNKSKLSPSEKMEAFKRLHFFYF